MCGTPSRCRRRLPSARPMATCSPIDQWWKCRRPWLLPGHAALRCHRRQWCCMTAAAAAQEMRQQSAEWTATQTLDEDRLQELAEQFDRFDVDQ